VPKSLYKEEYSDKLPEGPPLSIDSLYQTSYVVKDYPHEVRGLPIGQISPWEGEGVPLSIDRIYQTMYVVQDYPHEVSRSPIGQIRPFYGREETTLNIEFVLDKLWCQRLSTFKQIFCSDNSLEAITQYWVCIEQVMSKIIQMNFFPMTPWQVSTLYWQFIYQMLYITTIICMKFSLVNLI